MLPCGSVLERMLRRNPLAALALHRPARPDPPSPAPAQGPPIDALLGGSSDDDEATETAEARARPGIFARRARSRTAMPGMTTCK